MFAVDGELVVDLAADCQMPLGKPDVPSAFPDTPKSGSCSLFNCRYDGRLSTAEASDKTQLDATFKKEMVDMMSTTDAQQKLQPSFTFRIVEMVKHIRDHFKPGAEWKFIRQ